MYSVSTAYNYNLIDVFIYKNIYIFRGRGCEVWYGVYCTSPAHQRGDDKASNSSPKNLYEGNEFES